MTSDAHRERHERPGRLLSAIERAKAAVTSMLEERSALLLATYHLELRRTGMVLALSLVSAFLVCAAVSFSALGLAIALWDAHGVLGCAIIAIALGALALLCIHLIRSQTSGEKQRESRHEIR